jgi:UDP-glucose 4-epimerase
VAEKTATTREGTGVHVLVTGGLGFVGHAVTRDLVAAGLRTTVLTRGRADARPTDGAQVVTGDIRDRGRMQEIVQHGDFDAVCHLAALTRAPESYADPLTYFDVNVGGTLNLLMALEATRDSTREPVRFVFSSTNVVYGSRHTKALTEDLDPHPENPYAAAKLSAEWLVGAYAATGVIGATTLRFFSVAGAVDRVGDSDLPRIVPSVLRALAGDVPYMTLHGDGSAVRDFVHVLDAATAVRLSLAATKPGEHHLYNIGTGVGTSVAEVVRTAEEVVGRTVEVRHLPPTAEPQNLTADNSRAVKELGWHPAHSDLHEILADAWTVWS